MMPLVIVFFIFASALQAELSFLTGQGARLVLGQETFTSQAPGASETLLGGVGGVAYFNDTLFVADSNRLNASPLNHRVLIYRNLSTELPGPIDELPQGLRCAVCVGEADVVLGFDSFDKGDDDLKPTAADSFRVPLGVASNGVRLAVADTDNNRVLIWNSIPSVNGQPADLVLGQKEFTTNISNGFNPTATSLKGPQGVWWHAGRLFVADTGNNRVLIWNDPRSSGQAADVVLGQQDFTTFVQPDLTKVDLDPKADNLLTPVSVTSDGTRLYVTDLGHNRILIWNTIPTTNQAPADLVVGQPDMTSAASNNALKLCRSDGTDDEGNEIFPRRCAATLNFPRFALSDGNRLFIADGGNDRILVFDEIPGANGAPADHIIGQINEFVNLTSDSAFPDDISSAGVMRTPTSLAFDGLNLYATDPFNRRVLVFTMAEKRIDYRAVRNAASFEVYAIGRVFVDGETAKDEEVTITIQEEREYKYKVKEGDGLDDVVNGLVELINAGNGDPDVLATANPEFLSVILTARVPSEAGDLIAYAAEASENAKITVSTDGPNLKGGEEATKIPPGTIITIIGNDLSDTSEAAPEGDTLPTGIAGVQVYIDGRQAPLYYVSPGQINAQMPVEMYDTQSVSLYVRTVHRDGRVVASHALPVAIVGFNPGIFAEGGDDPRPALAFHGSDRATGVVSVDGSTKANDVVTVIIRDREYSYTVTQADQDAGDPEKEGSLFQGLERVMVALIEKINTDPEVEAYRSGQFTRIRLQARVAGPAGNGIPYGVKTSTDSSVILTGTTDALCCANQAGARITVENPAIPGETIIVYAAGLGLVEPDEARSEQKTGETYKGPEINRAVEFVSSLTGGRTANVLYAGLQVGSIGLYRVDLQLNQGLPTNPQTQLTIAQGFQVSNIVTFPVFNPIPTTQ